MSDVSDVRRSQTGATPGSPGREGDDLKILSLVPARIDRLRWAPFHTRMVAALGTAWVLDGIEITIASAVAAVLTESATLAFTSDAKAR